MKKFRIIWLFFTLVSASSLAQEELSHTILEDRSSIFYIDTATYPVGDPLLPIGVFDSGIGGLTVLDAIVNYDGFSNADRGKGSDGIKDFQQENFLYLADQANMPYGNYAAEGKDELLREHVLKDVQFLLGKKYYASADAVVPESDKSSIKALVIACNTATAYGKETIEAFLDKAGLEIKVIGVIDAGVRGALEQLDKNENATIAVMATAGTVASGGYPQGLYQQKEKLGYTGTIEVFSQGGVGIAEAVDEDTDYYDATLERPRENYQGPGFQGKLKIEKPLLEIYNFNYTGNRMLCEPGSTEDCQVLQINDAENYVRYHLVSLMEKIRSAEVKHPLKSIILGCTHYPYLTSEIKKGLRELYHYQEKDGSFRYRPYMIKDIQLIDPAVHTARELYEYLKEEKNFNTQGRLSRSEFFISVPNMENPNIQKDSGGGFTYAYKYGRNPGEVQEYVKRVPFSRSVISEAILDRLEQQLPNTFDLIRNFNENNEKTRLLDKKDRI